MKARLLIFSTILLSGVLLKAQAPPWVWARDANSVGAEYAWDASADTASHHVYIGGTFNGNLSAAYGAAFSASYGQDDGFLAKYTSQGAFQWAIKVGGTAGDQVKSVAVDPAGDVYICGYFSGTADFDPSAATFTLSASGAKDGFLAKYSPSGAFLWAVKYGGSGDDEPWKVYADANGVYITGSYASAPATFNSYSSAVTKTTVSANTNGEVFGAKYSPAGIAQWVISGGGAKVDCGYNVVADATNAYFIGRYDEDIIFRSSTGAASPVLQHQQDNKQQVFIIAYSQAAGTFAWQTNITCSQGGNDVVGWGIAQDASNLYVSGYLEGDINFKYPSPALTQNHTGGGGFDIFLARLSKSGTFTWRAAVTGSGSGDQVGRGVTIDRNGNVILSGYFMSTLNYSSAGGPVLSASAKDIFVASYSNSGFFQWATAAGNTGDDLVYGLTADNRGGIYITGSHNSGAIFGTYSLTPGGGASNIYVARLGCEALGNNTISASQTICSGNTPSSLTGSLPAGSGSYNYIWEKSPDNTAWTNATGTYTNQNYAPPALTANTYYRRKVQVTGVCAGTLISTPILISVDALPTTANAGSSQTVCSSSATLSANTPIAGTGLWSVVTGTGSVTSSANPLSPVTGLSSGINEFVWTISSGVCPSSSSTVTINRDLPPSISNAGASQTVCAASLTLAANAPLTGTGAWSVITGTGSVASPSDPSSTAVLSSGTNRFVWTISNGVCPSSSSTVTINRDLPPGISNAGISQTVCASSATLSATTPTAGAGVWSTGGIAVISNESSASTTVSGLSSGPNTFVWTISNGSCPSSSDTVTVTRDLPPTPSIAGISQTLCATTAILSANDPLVGSGTWSVVAGQGSIVTITDPLALVSGLSDGNNEFVWSIFNGVCPVSSSTVTIVKDASPTVPDAGTGQTICSSTATLNANVPVTGTAQWTLVSGTGFFLNPNLASSVITGLGVGSNSFAWTISNGVCAPLSDTVLIIRDDMPSAAVAGADKIICSSSDNLSANLPSIGTGTWSVISGNSSVAAPGSPTASVSNLSTGLNSFVWTVSNGVCSASRDTMSIQVDANPTLPDAGNDRAVCSDQVVLQGNVATVGMGSWTLVSGSGTFLDPLLNNTTVSSLGMGTTVFRWTIRNGICPALSDDVAITQDMPPDAAVAGNDQQTDYPVADLVAVTPTVGTGFWSVVEGPAEINDPSSPTISVTNLGIGANVFRWTVRNGVCPENMDELLVELSPLKIPNAFSPNGDGINEAFVVPGLEYYNHVKFSVFNRWSALLYENNNYKNEWTGLNSSREKLADDTYYYTLELPSIDKKYTGFIIIKTDK